MFFYAVRNWPRLPAYLRSRSSRLRRVFLLSSLVLFPSCAPLDACCPFGVVRSELVLFLSSWCVRVVFFPSSFCPLSVVLLMSSSGLSVVLPLSCCLRCFPRQGLGLRLPTTTTILANEDVWGLCWYNFWLRLIFQIHLAKIVCRRQLPMLRKCRLLEQWKVRRDSVARAAQFGGLEACAKG